MKLTTEQKSWVLSIIIHLIFIALFVISVPKKTLKETTLLVPIDVQIIEKKPQKKVVAKKLVTKKAVPKAKKKVVPTSLPGDRVQPAISKEVAPVYPKKALNNDWQGTVKVKVTVSSQGNPIAFKIVASSGHAVLDQSFIRSIKQNFKFKTKRKMGKNITGTIILTHTFSLEESLCSLFFIG